MGHENEAGASARVRAMVVLLGAGAGYGGGNIGPATRAIGGTFGISLSSVGLTMTVFFAAITTVTFGSAAMVRRRGARATIVLSCALTAAGNVLGAASPWFIGLLAGRALTGIGAGLAFVIGPVVARTYGGARLVGTFGAAVTLGIATALAVGSGLADGGVSWRVGLAISAVVGASALVVLPSDLKRGAAPEPRNRGFLAAALREPAVWRLIVLFTAANGIALVVGTWLIQYLVADGHERPWVAGVLGFVLFAVTAAMRRTSGRLADARPSRQRLAAASPLATAVGLIGLGLAPGAAPSVVWVMLMGVGFALPYALVLDRAQRVFPAAPASVIAVIQTGPNAVPMVVVPLVGVALDAGHGPAALFALAAFMALAAVVNAGSVPATAPQGALP